MTDEIQNPADSGARVPRTVISTEIPGGWIAAVTDPGTTRGENEDCLLVDPDAGLFAVADGMGGHSDGRFASSMVVGAMREFLANLLVRERGQAVPGDAMTARRFLDVSSVHDPEATIPDASAAAVAAVVAAIDATNKRLYVENRRRHFREAAGMGTTLTGLWHVSEAGPFVSFHVGDTRLYRRRNGTLTQLTRDHTNRQAALDMGIPTERLPKRNVLMRAIGPCAAVISDVSKQSVAPGDVFLICSDGLYGWVSDHLIDEMLRACTPDRIARCCDDLVAAAMELGSSDNVTAMIMLRDCKQAHGRLAQAETVRDR